MFGMRMPEDMKAICGVHYWGNSCPLNFWNSFDGRGIDEDFARIKADGFNTVIFVLPWGEFQPGLKPIRYDERVFGLLKKLIGKAEGHGLRFVLRLNYPWDFAPDIERRGPMFRFRELFSGEPEVVAAWKDYYARVYAAVKDSPNFLFGFITWEDFYEIFMYYAKKITPDERLVVARSIGYQAFLRRKYRLMQVSLGYGRLFDSWHDVPVPSTEEHAIKFYYEFFDDVLINRLFVPAKTQFPDLSIEVRIDADVVPEPEGPPTWFFHYGTYSPPDTPFIVTYFTPSLGAENTGKPESAADVLKRMNYICKSVYEHSEGRPIFIDQFNFCDNTPVITDTHNRIDPAELGAFIVGAADILRTYGIGYAQWAQRDYRLSLLYNMSFEIGLKGWQTEGEAYPVEGPDGIGQALLRNGASITQEIFRFIAYFVTYYRKAFVDFSARSADGTEAELVLSLTGFQPVTVKIGQAEQAFSVEFVQAGQIAPPYVFSVRASGGNAIIDEIHFYSHMQQSKLYDVNMNPGEAIAAVRKLNALLTGGLDVLHADFRLQNLIHEGFYDMENGYRFTSGGAKIHMHDVTASGRVTLYLDYFVPESFPAISAPTVMLNESSRPVVPLAARESEDPQYKLAFDFELGQDVQVREVSIISGSIVPRDLVPGSPDERRLGIAFKKLHMAIRVSP